MKRHHITMHLSIVLASLLILTPITMQASEQKVGAKKTEAAKEEHPKTPNEVQVDARKAMAITNDYVHGWIKFPSFEGVSIFDQKTVSFVPTKGEVIAVYFIASWCLPCQRLAKSMIQLERRYQTLHTKSVFVFTHDIKEDAVGFANEYGIRANAILADHKVLKTFHNPKLPSVYLSDRQTWLSKRHIEFDEKALTDIDQTLGLMTSY